MAAIPSKSIHGRRLDPDTFRDKATFMDSNQYSTGAKWVFVNGAVVIAGGEKTGKLPGRALRLKRGVRE